MTLSCVDAEASSSSVFEPGSELSIDNLALLSRLLPFGLSRLMDLLSISGISVSPLVELASGWSVALLLVDSSLLTIVDDNSSESSTPILSMTVFVMGSTSSDSLVATIFVVVASVGALIVVAGSVVALLWIVVGPEAVAGGTVVELTLWLFVVCCALKVNSEAKTNRVKLYVCKCLSCVMLNECPILVVVALITLPILSIFFWSLRFEDQIVFVLWLCVVSEVANH